PMKIPHLLAALAAFGWALSSDIAAQEQDPDNGERAEQVPEGRFIVEDRGRKDPHAVGPGFLQAGDLKVVVVVVAADTGLAGRFIILGEDRRPDRMMVPAGLGTAGP